MDGMSEINPTDIQNDFPSHVRHALHNLWSHHKCHHMLHLQCPLPPKYECDLPASVHLLPESRLPPEKQDRFLLYMHFFRQPLRFLRSCKKLHSYRWYNKCLCCFFSFFPRSVLRYSCSGAFLRRFFHLIFDVILMILCGKCHGSCASLQVRLLQVQCFLFHGSLLLSSILFFRRLRNSS